jgi:hypothetical protein
LWSCRRRSSEITLHQRRPGNHRRMGGFGQATREWLPGSGQSWAMRARHRRRATGRLAGNRLARRRGKNLSRSGRNRQRLGWNHSRTGCRGLSGNRRTNGRRWTHRWFGDRRLWRSCGPAWLLSNLGSRRRRGRGNFLRRLFDSNGATMAIALSLVRMVLRVFSIADRFESKMHSQLVGYVLIDGARVRHLFSDSHVR